MQADLLYFTLFCKDLLLFVFIIYGNKASNVISCKKCRNGGLCKKLKIE